MTSATGIQTEMAPNEVDITAHDGTEVLQEAMQEDVANNMNVEENGTDPNTANAETSYGHDLNQTANHLQYLQVNDATPSKSGKAESKGVMIKDGKLVYPEKKLRTNNHETVAKDLVEFRKYRAGISESMKTEEPFTISDRFHPLISLLVQDSDEAITSLSSRLNDSLSQFDAYDSDSDDPEDKQFNDALESTIKSLASRERYGVSNDVLQGLVDVPNIVPAHLSIYRWEVKDITGFPSDIKNAVEKRRRKRAEMSIIATYMFRTLTSEQQMQLLCAKRKKNSTPLPRINVTTTGQEVIFTSKENNPMTNGENIVICDEKVKESAEAKKKEAARKAIAEEKEAELEEKKKKKEDERKKKEEEKKKKDEERRLKDEEKKRREEEQQRKERSQLRLTSLFKTTTDERPSSVAEVTGADSQGHQIFPPFHVKEFVQMANPTAFRCSLSEYFENIIGYNQNDKDSKGTPDELLNEFKRSLRPALRQPRGVDHRIDLRTLLGHDPSMPLATAASFDGRDLRSMLKMKFLQFKEDIRPAYWGTWTKRSKKVLPRRPFAKDTEFLDYDHDSEAEWEPEGEGEDIKSGDEEDEDVDIADPDDAGWLVPEGYLSNDEGIGSDKDEEGVRTQTVSKKRGPVKQVCIGVLFEDSSDDDDPLAAYAIHQLGGTFPIDPFAAVASKQSSDAADNNTAPSSAPTDKRVTSFPVEHTTQLIDAIKGKAEGMPKLIAEVKAMQGFEDVSKRQIEATIKNIAVKEKRGSDARPIWYIKE
ncbi:hypothetical protein BGW37DRAFT_66327 [Umbelopsis sp. PMI_123]|nr:hypothetical protein BGW37DRAFT_66327 [Umbelopsis sp. PMI_123]